MGDIKINFLKIRTSAKSDSLIIESSSTKLSHIPTTSWSIVYLKIAISCWIMHGIHKAILSHRHTHACALPNFTLRWPFKVHYVSSVPDSTLQMTAVHSTFILPCCTKVLRAGLGGRKEEINIHPLCPTTHITSCFLATGLILPGDWKWLEIKTKLQNNKTKEFHKKQT